MNIGSSRADSIEVMIGLPHLAEGELMRRARDLGQPVLVSANALSRWSRRRGVREWAGWSTGCLTRDLGLASLSLDSAGFSAMVAYGGYPWTVADYVALAAAYPFQWWASLDYCVEPEVAADREEVLDRISRTVRANIDCRLRGEDAGIGARFLPVIQGRRPVDYERCADALSLLIDRSGLVGVGSMCRRPVHGPEGLVAVIDHLDRLLPSHVRLHLFGVKGDALPYLKAFGRRVASIDSQAYGLSARMAARRYGQAKTDQFVADHMAAWHGRQVARLSGRTRRLPVQPLTGDDVPPTDAWEQAIAQARHEIRGLIEDGDIDHDAMTDPWIEQWAAELLHEQEGSWH